MFLAATPVYPYLRRSSVDNIVGSHLIHFRPNPVYFMTIATYTIEHDNQPNPESKLSRSHDVRRKCEVTKSQR